MSEDIAKKYEKALAEGGVFAVKSVDNVNHRPHPYVIGPNHINRNRGIYLGSDQIREMEKEHGPMCCHPGCKRTYDEHESDKVLFLQLKRDATGDEANAELVKIREMMEADGIAGVCMVETDEKYRVKVFSAE